MKKTGLDFNKYVILACKYAYQEYEFGINSHGALFQLNREAIEKLNACWIGCEPIPNAANFIAKMVQGHGD
jgi:hypothetical protein